MSSLDIIKIYLRLGHAMERYVEAIETEGFVDQDEAQLALSAALDSGWQSAKELLDLLGRAAQERQTHGEGTPHEEEEHDRT